jgi:hypothetical protein
LDPVTLATQEAATATDLAVQNGVAITYDAASGLLFVMLQEMYQSPIQIVSMNALTLVVQAARTVTYSSPGFLPDLHPQIDSSSNNWMAPLSDSYLNVNSDPALLVATSSSLVSLLQLQNRGLQYLKVPRGLADPFTLYVAVLPDSSMQDGSAEYPFTYLQTALDEAMRRAAESGLGTYRIVLGAGQFSAIYI